MSGVQLERFDRRGAWQEDHVPNLRMAMVVGNCDGHSDGDGNGVGDGDAGGGGGDRGAWQGHHMPHHHCHSNLELQESKPHPKASSWSLAESLESMGGPERKEQIIGCNSEIDNHRAIF